ncbi:hypothetical protein D3C71_290410 [compost metagenome]
MFQDSWETTIHLERIEKDSAALKAYMIEQTAARLVDVTEEYADGELDWEEAIHLDGPDGDHSLIAVEGELTGIMEEHPSMIDAMRSSIEWENEIFNDDANRAARALVNESLESAKLLWAERLSRTSEI